MPHTPWRAAARIREISQIVEEELRYALKQQALRRKVADAVAASRKRNYFHIFSVFDQFIEQRQGVGEMHVVVAGAMSDQ